MSLDNINPISPKKERIQPKAKYQKTDPTRSVGLNTLSVNTINPSDVTPCKRKQIPPSGKPMEVKNSKMHASVTNMVTNAKKHENSEIDSKFLCSKNMRKSYGSVVEGQLVKMQGFDTASFLRGPKGQTKEVAESNQVILDQSVQFCSHLAHQIKNEQGISLQDAFKQVLGLIDVRDQAAQKGSPSSFALRSALLIASQKEGAPLESWMVYTKGGKPIGTKKWPFLDNWKNWVPEAQGVLAKFSETVMVKSLELAKEHPEKKVVLLKGGYGAGKTRQAKKLFPEKEVGVLAPDIGKTAVRRSMHEVTHAGAHVQGSQIAFKLFDDLIQEQAGTVAYDSSLSRPSDVKAYLSKCQKAGKKMVIYDVARHDMARILAVLRRDIEGEDPRIPPKMIIESAVRDKVNRVGCMQVVLEDTTTKESIRPEYHLLAGDSTGWNTEEIMVLKSNNSIELVEVEEGEDNLTRLGLEGITYNQSENMLSYSGTEEQVTNYFEIQFNLPVHQIVTQLSTEEQTICREVFEGREFPLTSSNPITTSEQLYQALPEKIQKAISRSSFEEAFKSVDENTSKNFFESIRGKRSFSYMDLPLKVALTLHQHFQTDPWKRG